MSVAAAVLLVLLAGDAYAQDPVGRALAAERAGDAAAARAAWQALIDGAPGSRSAARARTRLAWLDARSEGGFAPLSSLIRYQAAPPEARDRALALAFADEVDRMPAGLVRREARLAVGEDLVRVRELARARAMLEALIAEPGASEREQRSARDAIARALAAGGETGAALAYLEAGGLEGASTHEALARAELVRVTTPIAWTAIAAYALLALALASRAVSGGGLAVLRRAYPLAGVLAALWIALGPAVLATWYDDEATDTFALVAAGTLVIVALGPPAAASIGRGARLGLAGLAIGAQLAVAWLALLRSGGLISFV